MPPTEKTAEDRELSALEAVARALGPLTSQERGRVIRWAEARYLTPRALLAELAKVEPAERFRQMVASGLIDEDGRYLGGKS